MFRSFIKDIEREFYRTHFKNDYFSSLPDIWTYVKTITTSESPVTVKETEDSKTFIFKLPGLTSEDIKLTKENTNKTGFTLNLKAEKETDYSEKVDYTFSEYIPFKAKEITSKMSNGVLIVNIEKEKPDEKSNNIIENLKID